MSLDCILLGLLRQPRSGYDLKAEFDGGVANFWPAELSQIYVTLQRLRQRGSVRDRVTASGKGPAQRIYRRTPAGTKALRAWLAGDPLIGDERYSYVAQVYLMAELGGSQATLRFFTSLHKRLADRLKALHAIERGWAEVSPRYPDRLPADEFHQQLTVRLGLRTAVARLEWCGESIRRLRSWIRRMENDHDHDP